MKPYKQNYKVENWAKGWGKMVRSHSSLKNQEGY